MKPVLFLPQTTPPSDFTPKWQFHPFYCLGQKIGVSSDPALSLTPRIQFPFYPSKTLFTTGPGS